MAIVRDLVVGAPKPDMTHARRQAELAEDQQKKADSRERALQAEQKAALRNRSAGGSARAVLSGAISQARARLLGGDPASLSGAPVQAAQEPAKPKRGRDPINDVR